MLLVLGCWQPPDVQPPPPVQVEASDVLDGTAGEIAPEAEEGEGEGEAEEDAEEAEPTAEEPAVPAPPVAAAVSPWMGRTVGSPLTLVDDAGSPVYILRGPSAAVVVLMEGEDRVRVRCEACLPVVEGWLQKSAVSR